MSPLWFTCLLQSQVFASAFGCVQMLFRSSRLSSDRSKWIDVFWIIMTHLKWFKSKQRTDRLQHFFNTSRQNLKKSKAWNIHCSLTTACSPLYFYSAYKTLWQPSLLQCFESGGESRFCVSHGNHVLPGFSISDSYCCILFSNISLDYSQDFILLLFSQKHCDYFNRRESPLSRLKGTCRKVALHAPVFRNSDDELLMSEITWEPLHPHNFICFRVCKMSWIFDSGRKENQCRKP